MNIKQFNEKLVNAFSAANKNIAKRLDFNFFDGTLYFTIRSKKEGSVNCINASILALKPESKPHCIELSEVWVGYDQEGFVGPTIWAERLSTALA